MFWFATSTDHPSLTFDDRLALHALRATGASAAPLLWGEFPPMLQAGDVVVVRSCWDYHLAPLRFLAWLRALEARGVRVANGVDTLAWNLHKQYLLELHREHGIAIPPTRLVRGGESTTLGALMTELGTTQMVVKPAISLSAHDTVRYLAPSADAETAFAAQCARGDVLVQAFVEEIEHGEYSLVFFDNRYSHAVLKSPAPLDFRVQLDHGGTQRAVDPPADVVEQGERVLAATGATHAYARVDLVMAGGQGLLMELELIDPVLFFGFAGGAATARFVGAMQSLAADVACVP
jgi:glutathione synthase/RimK-type ligase-like ATP-grasp enzyme